MKTIHAHEAQAIVDSFGSIHVGDLPFAAGDRVRVIVLDDVRHESRHSNDQIQQSKTARDSLKGTILRYDNPNEPVGLEDWNLLKEDGANG